MPTPHGEIAAQLGSLFARELFKHMDAMADAILMRQIPKTKFASTVTFSLDEKVEELRCDIAFKADIPLDAISLGLRVSPDQQLWLLNSKIELQTPPTPAELTAPQPTPEPQVAPPEIPVPRERRERPPMPDEM